MGNNLIKKKSLNSGDKGRRIERELVKILTERFGEGFSRCVGSGNRWAQIGHMPSHARETYTSDLVCPVGWRFAVEVKGGYPGIDLVSVFSQGQKTIDSFLRQVTDDSQRSGRKPLLCWKPDRQPWVAFLKSSEIENEYFEYKLIYRDWMAVSLEKLLELKDDFFIEGHGYA